MKYAIYMLYNMTGGVSVKITFIAHDNKKELIINFTVAYRHIFVHHELYATGTTGRRISKEAQLTVNCFKSGPLGGDQQIGAMVANNDMDLIIFFRDPLTAMPHESDVNALLRLCDVNDIPVATNIATAELLIKSLERGDFSWREATEPYSRIRPTGTNE